VEKLETDIGAIVRQAVAHSSALAKIKGVELKMEFERDLPNIYADDSRIMQGLENLIGNAIKFSPAGSVISVRTRRDEDWILCEVVDRGPGVSESEVEQLFSDQSRRGDRAGPGMGMAL